MCRVAAAHREARSLLMTHPKSLLDPNDAVILFLNNTVALAEIAKVYDVPVIYSTVARAGLGLRRCHP
jgi:hypothetical protein